MCKTCGSNQTKNRWTEIVAAPKVLHIHLHILLQDRKVFHTLDHPEMLDLTAHQEDTKWPLHYKLSSVVSHSGDYLDVGNNVNQEAMDLALAMQLQAEEDEQYKHLQQPPASTPFQPAPSPSPPKTSSPTPSNLSKASKPSGVSKPQSPSSKASRKMMQGHYVTSVLEPDNTYSFIDDTRVYPISQADFISNPQHQPSDTYKVGQKFESYILTYIRDDSVRHMPTGKWMKELRNLGALNVVESNEGRNMEGLRWPGVGKKYVP